MSPIVKPALHTLWQASLASLVLWYQVAGSLGIHAVHNFSDAKRFAASAAVGILAALASAAMHTVGTYGPKLAVSALTAIAAKADLPVPPALTAAVTPAPVAAQPAAPRDPYASPGPVVSA